ncbi:MAG: DUF1489 domain-containing protein [Pseudomonadota bacterium]
MHRCESFYGLIPIVKRVGRGDLAGYVYVMTLNMIKLIVGVETLEDYALWQERAQIDYHGQPAVECWTRFKPKREDEILRTGGSLYRVHKSRILCRQKILGFEMVEVEGHGTKCMIMLDPEIITTVNAPHRPFQGWRYFEGAKAPEDRGVYVLGGDNYAPPPAMEDDLKAAGLL